MARIRVRSDRATALRAALVPAMLRAGSVAALVKRLNAAAPGSERLHPNRLHALIAGEEERSLNERTVDMIELALDALRATGEVASDDEYATFVATVRRLAEAEEPARIARSVGMPERVVRDVLGSTDPRAPRLADTTPEPDWSFQDDAVRSCVAALRRTRRARSALVIPTGGGKTRTALRVADAFVPATSLGEPSVVWVTHQRNLRAQADRTFQSMRLEDAVSFDDSQIAFMMIAEAVRHLAERESPPNLVIIDEAHHAAAPSYQQVLDARAPVLFLTATPNRADRLSIGAEEIAYSATFADLVKRGVILRPRIEDFPVEDFDWSPRAVADLADAVIDRCDSDFQKVLVIAPRIDRVKEFYNAIAERAATRANGAEPDAPSKPLDRIGYVVGNENGLLEEGDAVSAEGNEDFLRRFRLSDHGILVSSQLLLEGFDDPKINAVVVTYPTSSVVRLMQAAGRAVRWAPNKDRCFVLLARNDQLAYHFDHRWLYQEISDYLRPELLERTYADAAELRASVQAVLAQHQVRDGVTARILEQIADLAPGEHCRLLLYGLPYFGPPSEFSASAEWGALLETDRPENAVRAVFNAFCDRKALNSDATAFLRTFGPELGLVPDKDRNGEWVRFHGLISASFWAREEVYGSDPDHRVGQRPHRSHGPTTWLRYVTFSHERTVSSALEAFLRDCHNRDGVLAQLSADADLRWIAKVPLPLKGSEAVPMRADQLDALARATDDLRQQLTLVQPGEQFGALARFLADVDAAHLPSRLLRELRAFVGPDAGVRTFSVADDRAALPDQFDPYQKGTS